MSGADIDSIIIEAYNEAFKNSKDRSQKIKEISIEKCIEKAKATKSLEARKEADEDLVKEGLRNYKISSGRMHWDMDKESRIQQAINEYRLSSNSYDYTLSDDELVDDAISNIKISQGQTYLNNEQELRKLIRAKIKRARKHDDEMLKIIRKKVDDEERRMPLQIY